MNDNVTGRKEWYFEGWPYPNGKITVILEEEGRRLVRIDFSNSSHGERPMYYIQKTFMHSDGTGHWVDVHYDRSKNKMIRRFKNL